ncbi:sulfatase family protein [Haloferula sp.]|uniref:sulfatase family protein n=1 Tax=Haloferula sp. TaxID=2497595 RepID=UPI003C78F6DD
MMFRIHFLLLACWVGQVLGATLPNFVFFLGDDISPEDLGCYGNKTIHTPNIDALAGSGMRFTNAYLTTSSCSPSRCSIITGRYPHNTGAPELHLSLPATQIRFPELLREAGYYTVLSGKNHMFGNKDRAFDKITQGGGPGREEDWVDLVKNRPKDQPFFFWFASTDAHRDFVISEHAPQYDPADVVVPPYLPDHPVIRQELADYYHEISRLDHYIGEVVGQLRKEGILNQTIIIVAADNGRPFPRCKTRLYDSGIKTPWIVQYPPLVPEPRVSASLISSIDLSATCLDLAGIVKPPCIQGISFTPILKDPESTVREVVFAEQNWHVYSNHSRMVRFGDFLYIKNNYRNQMNLSYESGVHYPSGAELWSLYAAGMTKPVHQQVFANPVPNEELYHISRDPYQLRNSVDQIEFKRPLERARTLLQNWTKQTGDSVPVNPTPNRHAPPGIEDGKVVPPGENGRRHPGGEMPGTSRNAERIDHPGPVTLE